MSDELMNCPFCGGEAKIIGGITIDGEPCAECGDKSCSYVSSDYMTIKQWNTRAQPKYKLVDLDSLRYPENDPLKPPKLLNITEMQRYCNRAIDDIKSKYGDLFIEIKE